MGHLKYYLPLSWFKNNPLELPYSNGFFQKNLYFYILVELFIQINVTDIVEATVEVALETGLTLLFVAFLLFIKKALAGYIPAATSFLVCENVAATFGLPVILWLTTTDDPLSYYALLFIILWDLAMISYLVKRIMNIKKFYAFLIGFSYFMATYVGAFSFMLLL